MSNSVDTPGRELAFERVWHSEMPRILLYATRHVGATDAHDVAAETFATAWRRWDDITDPPFAWLLGVARHVVSNHIRKLQRGRRLEDRIRLLTAVSASSGQHLDFNARLDGLHRLAGLREKEREALLLTAWDGLTTEQAATLLAISPAAVRKRISKARAAISGTELAPTEHTHSGDKP